MNNQYEDIRCRIAEDPVWWDERAVPRYCKFSPNRLANIYARECCLLLVACQDCGHAFRVAMSWNTISSQPPALDSLDYGDPPNIDCCPAGPTMSTVTLSILEFWQLHHPAPGRQGVEWRRRHQP
jgi:hypothetical protein